MHLCEACRSSRDWPEDPVVRTKIALQAQADENRKARCGDCRGYMLNPMFRLCEACAGHSRLCQHCNASTMTDEEKTRRAAEAEHDERLQVLLDLFTASRKAYGLSETVRLFQAHAEEIGHEPVAAALAFNADKLENDPDRKRRPIWTKVFGSNVFRFRFCDGCASLPRRPPSLAKAAFCPHFTTVLSPALCPVCAAAESRCEGCGAPVE